MVESKNIVIDFFNLGTIKDISPICFGTLNIKPMSDEFARVLEVVPDQTFIDTAEICGSENGETEEEMSKALLNNKHQQYLVGTKFAPLPWRRRCFSVVSACQESLKRLGKEKIDFYQIHYADRGIFGYAIQDETFWDGVAQCYEDGLISNIGVCNYGPNMIHGFIIILPYKEAYP